MVRRTFGCSPSSPSSTVTSVTTGRSASAMVVMPRSADGAAAGAEQHRGDVGDDLVDQPGRRGTPRPASGRPRGRRAGGRGRRARRAPSRGSRVRRCSVSACVVEDPLGRGSRSRSPITTRSGWLAGSGWSCSSRTVSCGSSTATVLVPTSITSHSARSRWVSSRAARPETQRLVPSAAALRPSRVVANFQVTNGRPCSTANVHTRLSAARLVDQQPRARPRRRPSRSVAGSAGGDRVGVGLGEDHAAYAGVDAAPRAHGPVRPVWLHGSRVTTAVVPRAALPGPGQRVGLGVRGAGAAVVALGDRARRRRRAARSRPAGWGRAGRRASPRARGRAASRPARPA